MGTSKNALFPQWRRHQILLLQNRHTVLPVHKHRTRILMYYSYTAVLRAMLPCPYEKITIFRSTQMYGNLDL